MWSRKPTPVLARARAARRRGRARGARRSRRCVRSILAVAAHRPAILAHRAPPSTRACTSKPSARAIGAPRARELRGAPRRRAPRPCAGGSGAAESPEAKRAAPPVGSDVVGAGDVVAERGARSRRRRTGSRRACTRGASASTSAPISCRCSGANALASSSAAASVRDLDERERASPTVRRSPRQPLELGRERVEQAGVGARRRRRGCPRRARPGRAGRARRARRRARASAEHDDRSLGPGEAVDADALARAGAWPPARRGCPGRRSRRRGRTVSVP